MWRRVFCWVASATCLLAEIVSSTLKLEAICSSETSVATQQTTRRHIPEEDTLHNLTSYKLRMNRDTKTDAAGTWPVLLPKVGIHSCVSCKRCSVETKSSCHLSSWLPNVLHYLIRFTCRLVLQAISKLRLYQCCYVKILARYQL
jgi:hypothetical protein